MAEALQNARRKKQLPLSLIYCMVSNKVQTFDKVNLYLPETFFPNAQLFVALSTVRRRQHLKTKMT